MNAFTRSCKRVAKSAQLSEDNLAFLHQQIQGTIQQNTENLTENTRRVKKYGRIKGDTYEWRRSYIEYFNTHKTYFYDNMMSILSKDVAVADNMLKLFLECEGLGLPKANFLCQLATARPEFACLDSNNLIWHGINSNITSYSKKTKSETAKFNKRSLYFETVYGISPNNSGLDLAWDWCKGVNKKSKKFKSATEIAILHEYWFILDTTIGNNCLVGKFC